MWASQTAGMSIATRPPGPAPMRGSRNGGRTSIGISRPPTELLPDGGTPAPALAPAPERVLARDAPRLIRGRRVDDRSREADVSFVRDQLEPIRSRRSLAASYRREATLAGATGLAYALRWLELGPDRS